MSGELLLIEKVYETPSEIEGTIMRDGRELEDSGQTGSTVEAVVKEEVETKPTTGTSQPAELMDPKGEVSEVAEIKADPERAEVKDKSTAVVEDDTKRSKPDEAVVEDDIKAETKPIEPELHSKPDEPLPNEEETSKSKEIEPVLGEPITDNVSEEKLVEDETLAARTEEEIDATGKTSAGTTDTPKETAAEVTPQDSVEKKVLPQDATTVPKDAQQQARSINNIEDDMKAQEVNTQESGVCGCIVS